MYEGQPHNHHRRDIYRPHLRQIKSYALHRGFFARKFPATSLRFNYFVPSIFTVCALLGWTTVWLNEGLFKLWGAVMLLYTTLTFIFSLRTWNLAGILGVLTGTFITHIVYGFWFIAGLLTSEIKDS